MSETSAPAGLCYRLLICARFHGPGAARSSFRKGDYRAAQMVSRMHLGTAVAAAHSLAQHALRSKLCPVHDNTSSLNMKRAQLKQVQLH